MGSDNFADFERVDAMFRRALDLPADEREAYIREGCRSDPELHTRLQDMLRAAEDPDAALPPGGALHAGARQAWDAEEDHPAVARPGERFGPWQALEEIGHGGMAVVWLGERADGAYQQRVAIKILRAPRVLAARFARERSILARLNHPNIAGLLDGGTLPDGRSYLVMEYVDGQRIDRYCDRQKLSIDDRLRLFLAVCEAVQFAHQHLIVHRDLKPSNILVTAEGLPKLLDFGVAKLLEDDALGGEQTQTLFAQRMMTPQYASPEQILGEAVSTATDIYALGLLLYELLGGHRAREIDSSRPSAIEKAVCHTEPVAPSRMVPCDILEKDADEAVPAERIAAVRQMSPRRLQQRLKGDLDNIVLKALRTEPEHRYSSAERLAEDVRAHLASRPVQARPPRVAYRTGKFVRRHAVGVAATLAVLLLTGTLIAYYTDRLAHERDLAAQFATEAQAETERAAAALARTERALARAKSLHEFLIGLFRSAEPDRPRDQLPDTEALLELGARRALDEDSAPPGERLGMMLAIGRVYLEQNRFDDSRPLFDAAVALARDRQPHQPEDLARALLAQARLAWRGDRVADAEAPLLEAESLVEGNEAHRDIYAQARGDRGWVAFLQGNRRKALALLEPLYADIRQAEGITATTRYHVANALASTYRSLGRLEASSQVRSEANEHALRAYGAESLTYAIHLANTSNLEHDLGRYPEAESLNRRALALYDRIYGDSPAIFRAVARRNLVRKLITQGRFDEAVAELENSTDEFARARGMPVEDDASHFFYNGEMLMRMHRWQEAENNLMRARELFRAASGAPGQWLDRTEAMLAWSRCRQGKPAEAQAVIDGLDTRREGRVPDGGSERAQLHSARACVQLHHGNLDRALDAVDRALAAVPHPGRIVARAERMRLRARILAAMNNDQQAQRQTAQARQVYLDAGLGSHPLLPRRKGDNG